MRQSNSYDPIFQPFLDYVYTPSHSEGSVSMNLSGLKNFQSFVQERYGIKISELISKIKIEELNVYIVLQDFVVYCDKKEKKPNTIKCWMSPAKGFLRQMGIKIYSEDFKQSVRLPKAIRQREEPLTKETIIRILQVLPLKLRAAVLVAVASGMRIGEIVQLKISDIDFDSKPTKIKIRGETTKTREDRETYLTDEATRILIDYLIKYYGWKKDQKNENLQSQIIFDRTTALPKNKPTPKSSFRRRAIGNLEASLRKYTSAIPELALLNQNGRFQVHFHAFRKFFYTTVSNSVNGDFANALLGHHFYLDTYYNMPEQKRKELYIKGEPYLTISDFTKIEKDLNKISERQTNLEEEHDTMLQFLRQFAINPSLKHVEKLNAIENHERFNQLLQSSEEIDELKN